MARTKKLTDSQIAGLKRLTEGKADYYDLTRSGSSGPTAAWLVGAGLATEEKVGGGKEWQITEAGRATLAAGRITIG